MIGQILYSSMVYHQIEMKEDYDFEFFHSSNDTSSTFFFSNLKGASRYYLVKMVLLGRQLQGNCCSEGRRWLWGGLGEASTLDSVLC